MEKQTLEEKIEQEIKTAQTIYWVLIACVSLPAVFISGAAGTYIDDKSFIHQIVWWLAAFSYPGFIFIVFTSRYFAKEYLRMDDYKKARQFNIIPVYGIIFIILLFLFM
ncbi:hypothetical protein [Neobacillus sp. OS1-33]|jgi:hypothetical protein|uniref:hypothetical protein n=1 Tax=Neobacillus sp. OS1-33 TaxID=3070683 RepID=UPI0027DF7E3E|nr:hypothetical protein [Neobacillus sp. OS1-33]WML26764.1 hypothetical protein RCG22_03730 [Neobacillus sp. OS1-33]